MLPRLVKRPLPSRAMLYLSPVLAVILTLFASILLFLIMGVSPAAALHAFFIEPVSSAYGVSELLVKATPLVLIGVALSFGFRANVWNIGAEGQLILGGIFSASVALFFYEKTGFYIIPLILLAGILGGLFWASIVAFLRTQFNASEILSSLMLSYVANLLLNYLMHGALQDPDGMNFPESRLFSDSALLPILIDGTRLHIGALIALVAVGLGWILLSHTLLGYQIKVIGDAPAAGKYAGFSHAKIIWITLLLSGGIAGIAGAIEVTGPIGQLVPTISPGYGFTAIIVAYVGRLHPVGVLFAGLLLALSYLGGETAQINLGLPTAVTGVFQGLLLFFLLACDVLIHYQLSFSKQEVST
jgi:simple sugar transport system permease protein